MGRSFYLKEDGKEVTQWFFGPAYSWRVPTVFLIEHSSYYYLEILEDATLYSISSEKMNYY